MRMRVRRRERDEKVEKKTKSTQKPKILYLIKIGDKVRKEEPVEPVEPVFIPEVQRSLWRRLNSPHLFSSFYTTNSQSELSSRLRHTAGQWQLSGGFTAGTLTTPSSCSSSSEPRRTKTLEDFLFREEVS